LAKHDRTPLKVSSWRTSTPKQPEEIRRGGVFKKGVTFAHCRTMKEDVICFTRFG